MAVKIRLRLNEWLAKLLSQVRRVSIKVMLGTAILFSAGVIYLEPYVTDTFSCLGDMIQAPTEGRSIEWKCTKDTLDVLRDDGTAATVILAIAAAVLASAWSSGSRSAE